MKASMEIPLSPGNSIYNSSFEAECNEQKEVFKKRYTKCSKMLQKAIDTTDDAMMLSRQCHMNCLEHLQESDIREARTKYWTKTYKNRLEWLYDKFDEARRKNDQLQFLIDGGNVACQRCFRALYMINKTGYYKVLTRYRRGSISIGNRRGRDESKITKEAYRWLKEYAYFHSDRMPDTGHQMLPNKTRKNSIYKLYVDEKTENMEYSVSEATFNKVWRTQIPNLKIKQTNSFSKCATCVSIERELERTRNPSKRKKLMGMITVHNGRQMRERRFYYAKREKAKREYKRYMSIIIDGMDQSKTDLPHFCGRLQKGIDPTGMLKTHIQGVLNHGKGTLTTYVDINESSHDANLIMNILLRTFFDALDKNGRLPRILYIQADNCARENKNKFLLAFCELLVKLNVFHEVNLSFLYVGHTHEDIDAAFSQISEKLRRQDVITLPGILEMLGRGRLVKGMFDIKSWLLPLINEIGGHSKPLHFRFAEDEAGVKMMYRADSSKPWSKCYENMLRDIPTGQPKILIPPNIDQIDTRAIQKNV
ncbi:hypothetical protein FSP39_003259 [Pinctada imbricata]|uniref:DUF7869 domain-containing protein n=1 Tax=Pinctada imbricata TaxID=66713 RepID=A0AA88YWJ1_PINIB|nr:hypothetical protein FSP39_003259 [Pinctada imbricata]